MAFGVKIFSQRSFLYFFLGRFFLFFGVHMQMNAISLQVYYQYTQSEFMLGLTGLCEAVPFMLSALYMGHLADRYEKKFLIGVSLSSLMLLMVFLTCFHFFQSGGYHEVYIILGAVCLFGFIRAMFATSLQSLLPQIIHPKWYEQASTWNSSAWHIASIAGPLLSTYLFIGKQENYHPERVYAVVFGCYALAVCFFRSITYPAKGNKNSSERVDAWSEMRKGVDFVWNNKTIFSALLLDMLAVLFGGVSAIVPAYVDKTLHLPPEFVAYFRMAPAIGALVMSGIMMHITLLNKAGKYLLYSVCAYGLCTIGIALSPDGFWAFVFLFLSGAADNISIVIRHTLLQILTPDHLRGKVSAINSIFIGSSNEIGAFESGTAARLMGIRPSVFFGGCMTLLSVAFVYMKYRSLYFLNLKSVLK